MRAGWAGDEARQGQRGGTLDRGLAKRRSIADVLEGLREGLETQCQRQSKSEPKGSAKCGHFGVGQIAAWVCASIRAAALVIELAVARMLWPLRAKL